MNILKLIGWHILFFLLGTALFVVSFRLPLFSGMNILFYKGIVLLLLSSALTALVILYLKKTRLKKLLTYRDIVLSITIILSFNMLFFTHVPVTADRSISVFILGYMNNNSSSVITEDDVTNYFIEKYVKEYKAVDRRFAEQIASGNIEKSENGYTITKRGRSLMSFYDLISDVFLIDKKFVSPK